MPNPFDYQRPIDAAVALRAGRPTLVEPLLGIWLARRGAAPD
jgi:hypothetical protein